MADDNNSGSPVDTGSPMDITDQDQQDKNQGIDQGTPADDGTTLDLAQFKNPKDMLKSYKEIQGAFTKVTQDNADLRKEVAEMRSQMQLQNVGGQQPVMQPIGQSQTSFDEKFTENPEGAIKEVAGQHVVTMNIAEVLQEEMGKNPTEYNERYGYAQVVSQQHPHLTTTAAGIRQLFKLGDELRERHSKAQYAKFTKTLLEDYPALKNLIGQPQRQDATKGNAFMPDTTSSTRSRTDDDQIDFEKEKADAAKKGDVDGALDAVFGQIVEESKPRR